MKKKIPLIIGAGVLVLATSIFVLTRNNKTKNNEEAAVTKKKISRPVNLIPTSERPFMQLEPSSDGHYITLNILELKKEASDLEYEMEYQTGSMLQGFQGMISLDELPTSEKKLFGSRSAGGSVTYHEDIKGGNLLATFEGGEGYAVKSAWRYFTNSENETEFNSQDTKFSISNDDLAKYSYIVIFNSPGYPGELKNELISDVYTISAEKSLKILSSKFEVSIRTNSETAQIMGYDGEEWIEIETELTNGLAQGSAAVMEAYLLTNK